MNNQEGEVGVTVAPTKTIAEAEAETSPEQVAADHFFYELQTSEWLLPDDRWRSTRVFEFSERDFNRHGLGAVLLLPTRPNAEPHMDRMHNLTTLAQLQKSFKENMFPLPDDAVSVAWQATLVSDPQNPANSVLLHVVAMHRRPHSGEEEILSLNKRLEELKKR